MEQHAFDVLRGLEHVWWYRGRAHVVQQALKQAGTRRFRSILDFGAGFGGMRAVLAEIGDRIDGFEPEPAAAAIARTRGYARIFANEHEALSHRTDLIGLFDVLEHLRDDRHFLRLAAAALNPDGRLVITVPAMPSLWSEHDVAHHHFRRYTLHELRQTLEGEGFRVEYARYWNTLMWPLAALMIRLGRGGEAAFRLPAALDRLLYAVIVVETAVMRWLRLPLGVSIVAVARKT